MKMIGAQVAKATSYGWDQIKWISKIFLWVLISFVGLCLYVCERKAKERKKYKPHYLM
jgi:hypothetical protein